MREVSKNGNGLGIEITQFGQDKVALFVVKVICTEKLQSVLDGTLFIIIR